VFHTHVVSVSGVLYACCWCFIWMLQVFLFECCKSISGDVACVAMDTHVCCKRLFEVFQLFQTDVATVLLDVAK
jgi:hypothetical protein